MHPEDRYIRDNIKALPWYDRWRYYTLRDIYFYIKRKINPMESKSQDVTNLPNYDDWPKILQDAFDSDDERWTRLYLGLAAKTIRDLECKQCSRCYECGSELVFVEPDTHFGPERYDCPVCLAKLERDLLKEENENLKKVLIEASDDIRKWLKLARYQYEQREIEGRDKVLTPSLEGILTSDLVLKNIANKLYNVKSQGYKGV